MEEFKTKYHLIQTGCQTSDEGVHSNDRTFLDLAPNIYLSLSRVRSECGIGCFPKAITYQPNNHHLHMLEDSIGPRAIAIAT
eukprot:1304441-Amphidinium_carterae.1